MRIASKEQARERPVFHQQLGAELRELRETRGWSLSDAVHFARRRKLPALSLNKLRYLEEGRTKHPDAEVLLAIATLYEIEYLELATRFFRGNYGAEPVAGVPTTPARGAWRLLQPEENEVLELWRVSSDDGRQGARAVLAVSKTKRRKGTGATHLKARA